MVWYYYCLNCQIGPYNLPHENTPAQLKRGCVSIRTINYLYTKVQNKVSVFFVIVLRVCVYIAERQQMWYHMKVAVLIVVVLQFSGESSLYAERRRFKVPENRCRYLRHKGQSI
jgi:hypothetical protein